MVSEQPTNRQSAGRDTADGRTVLLVPLGDRLRLFLGAPAVALLVALLLPPLSRWLVDLRMVIPVRPVFRLLAAIDQWWEIAIAVVVALLIGAAVALVRVASSTRVAVSDGELRLASDDWKASIARPEISTVFLDGDKLVVLDEQSRHLASEPTRLPSATLAEAFRRHGYPWHDTDPYLDLYRRWVPDTSDLPPAVNAVLEAREAALKRKARNDIRDLRDAVQRLGFAVREEGAKQYWRPLVRS